MKGENAAVMIHQSPELSESARTEMVTSGRALLNIFC